MKYIFPLKVVFDSDKRPDKTYYFNSENLREKGIDRIKMNVCCKLRSIERMDILEVLETDSEVIKFYIQME